MTKIKIEDFIKDLKNTRDSLDELIQEFGSKDVSSNKKELYKNLSYSIDNLIDIIYGLDKL